MNENTKIWVYAKSPFKSDYANVLHLENEIEQNKKSKHLEKSRENRRLENGAKAPIFERKNHE